MLLHTSSLHTNTASLLRTDPEAPVYNCCSVRVVWAYCCVIMHIASWCVLKQVVFTCTFRSCKGGQVCLQVIIIQDCFSQYSFIWTFIFLFFLWNFISNLCVSPAWCDSCGEPHDLPSQTGGATLWWPHWAKSSCLQSELHQSVYFIQ